MLGDECSYACSCHHVGIHQVGINRKRRQPPWDPDVLHRSGVTYSRLLTTVSDGLCVRLGSCSHVVLCAQTRLLGAFLLQSEAGCSRWLCI